MNLHDNTALLIHQVERASEPDEVPSNEPTPTPTPAPTPKPEAQSKYTFHRIEVETAEKLAKGMENNFIVDLLANKSSTEFLYLLANEPSIGLFHVEEHIRKSVNKFSETKTELKKSSTSISEAMVDVDYALLTVKSLVGLQTFSNIQNMLLKSHQTAEQLSGHDGRGKPIGKPAQKELTSYREKVVTYAEPASPAHNAYFAPIRMQDQEPKQSMDIPYFVDLVGASSDFMPKKFE